MQMTMEQRSLKQWNELKTLHGPLWWFKMMMQRTANENAACYVGSVKDLISQKKK